jgi:hypothetical protein
MGPAHSPQYVDFAAVSGVITPRAWLGLTPQPRLELLQGQLLEIGLRGAHRT